MALHNQQVLPHRSRKSCNGSALMVVRKRAECCFKSTVLKERTHRVLRQALWVSAKDSVSSFWHTHATLKELTELSLPGTRWGPKNSLSSVFEAVLSETLFSPPPRNAPLCGGALNHYILTQGISKWHFSAHGAVWRRFPCLDGLRKSSENRHVDCEFQCEIHMLIASFSAKSHFQMSPPFKMSSFRTLKDTMWKRPFVTLWSWGTRLDSTPARWNPILQHQPRQGKKEYTPPPWDPSFLGLSPDPEVTEQRKLWCIPFSWENKAKGYTP